METERRVETPTDEVSGLRQSREKVFQAPPIEWIKDRLDNLHDACTTYYPTERHARPRRCGTCSGRSV